MPHPLDFSAPGPRKTAYLSKHRSAGFAVFNWLVEHGANVPLTYDRQELSGPQVYVDIVNALFQRNGRPVFSSPEGAIRLIHAPYTKDPVLDAFYVARSLGGGAFREFLRGL